MQKDSAEMENLLKNWKVFTKNGKNSVKIENFLQK